MPDMTIGMITSWQEHCGIAAYSDELVAALAARVEVRVILPPKTETSDAALDAVAKEANACEVIHIQHEYTFFNGLLPRSTTFLRLVDRFRRPLVLTAHSVLPVARLLRVDEEQRPVRRALKGLASRWPPFRDAVECEPYRRADQLIVHTRRCRERLIARGISKERIHWIPAGIPVLPPAGELPPELRDFLNESTVAVVGYVSPNKGHDLAVQALEKLPGHVRLVIAGGTRVPSERGAMDALRAEITCRDLDDRVFITGFLAEETLAAVLERSRLVLAPHREATGSYSVTLPVSAGRAVIASDLACFREIQEEGRCVTLVPPGDPEALAREIRRLLEDATALAELERHARGYAERRTWEAAAERTLVVYERAVGKRIE
jgi:glycosyltransferase involved in cell wall biosynthesis